MSHPVGLLRRELAADPSRPLLTFYDDATEERVELSVKTFDNWVAKTANLLVDGLGAEPGARVALALPVHWQTAVWLYACWAAGLVALPVDDGDDGAIPADCDIVAAAPDRLEAALAATKATPAEDYAVEVRAHGDHFGASVDEDAPAVEVAGETLTGAELVAAGASTPHGARVLTTVSYATRAGLINGLIGPLTSHGSAIICQNLEQRRLERRISLEHVTAVIDPGSTHSATRPSL